MTSQSPTKAILLINLGSPESCTVPAIRRFLGEFLTDPDVITLKSPFRQILFKGIVAPIRSRKILEKYEAIWHESGLSPLHYFTDQMVKQLQRDLGADYIVEQAMRYQKPSIQTALENLAKHDLNELTIVPLFPQEAKETTGSIYHRLNTLLPKFPNLPKLQYINNYFDADYYIDGLVELYQQKLTEFKPDVVLWSYHGLPNQSVKPFCTKACIAGGFQKPCHATGQYLLGNKSCYRAQCFATSRALEGKLNLDTHYQTVFQSRFGPLKWIGPGLLTAMEEQVKANRKRIAIACPSFVTDCLETLEEVNIAAREYWQELGGEDFLFLPCVNDQAIFVNGLAELSKSDKGVNNE